MICVIQAQKESTFSERMYIYNYRLFNRYKKPIVSVAILADDNPHWRPSSYERLTWYTQVLFNFRSIKLLDYAEYQQSLLNNRNPFAIVIWAHLQALKTRNRHAQRLQSKLAITRILYERGFSKDYIVRLFHFIDWVMELPEPLELQYTDVIEQLEEKKHMRYVSSVERIITEREKQKSREQGMQEGREEGRQKGREEGKAEGRKEGLQEGERALLQRQLQQRFGALSPFHQDRLNNANTDQLRFWSDLLFKANTLDDIFIKPTADTTDTVS